MCAANCVELFGFYGHYADNSPIVSTTKTVVYCLNYKKTQAIALSSKQKKDSRRTPNASHQLYKIRINKRTDAAQIYFTFNHKSESLLSVDHTQNTTIMSPYVLRTGSFFKENVIRENRADP